MAFACYQHIQNPLDILPFSVPVGRASKLYADSLCVYLIVKIEYVYRKAIISPRNSSCASLRIPS